MIIVSQVDGQWGGWEPGTGIEGPAQKLHWIGPSGLIGHCSLQHMKGIHACRARHGVYNSIALLLTTPADIP